MTKILAALCLLALHVVASPALAGEERIDFDDPAAQQWLGERWFGLYRGQARVGWMRRSLRTTQREDRPVVVREAELFVNVAGDGNTVGNLTRTVFSRDGDQLLIAAMSRHVEQGAVTLREIVRNSGRFDVTTTRAGKTQPGAVAAVDTRLADELGAERLVRLVREAEAPPEELDLRVGGLDLSSLRRTALVLRYRADEQEPAGAVPPNGYALRTGDGGKRWSRPMLVDAAGAILEGDLYAGLIARREARESATASAGMSTLEQANRIPLGGQVGDPDTIRKIVFSAAATARGAFVDTGRQTVEERDGRVFVTVVRDADSGPITKLEQQRALAPTPRVNFQVSAITDAANKALRGTMSRAGQVPRLLRFVRERLTYMVVLGDPSDSRVLETRRGDCTEFARLFIALCRSARIPARRVRGLLWMGEDVGALGWHAWAEVGLTDIWREVDPTGGREPAHAVRLRVTDVVVDILELGDLDLRVESIERDPPR